jgi:hypothetical protein
MDPRDNAADGDFDDLDLGDEPESVVPPNPFDDDAKVVIPPNPFDDDADPPPVGADDNWWGADKGVSRAEEAAVAAATTRTAPIDASAFAAAPHPPPRQAKQPHPPPQIDGSSDLALSRGNSDDSDLGDLLMDPSTAGQMRRGSHGQDHSEVVASAKSLALKLGALSTEDADEDGGMHQKNGFNKYDVDPDDEMVGNTFTTTLERAEEGFGIVLDHSKNDESTQLVWVDDVVPETPAFYSKIKQGDMLLEVNGVEIKTASINTIVKALTHELVKLVVYRPPAQDQLSSTCTGVFDARQLAPASPMIAVKTKHGIGSLPTSPTDSPNRAPPINAHLSLSMPNTPAGGRRGSKSSAFSSPLSSIFSPTRLGRRNSYMGNAASAIPSQWADAVGTWKQTKRTSDGAERMLSIFIDGKLQLMKAKFPSREVVDGVITNWETDALHGQFTTAQLTIRSRSIFVGMTRRWYLSLHKPVEEDDEKHPTGTKQVTMKGALVSLLLTSNT